MFEKFMYLWFTTPWLRALTAGIVILLVYVVAGGSL